MLPVSRQINWLSSDLPENAAALIALQHRMAEFYTKTPAYYEDIDFTAGAWRSDPVYQAMIARVRTGSRILEVGCGRANILTACPELAPKYTGVDFSEELLRHNAERVPGARFLPLGSPKELPFPDASFDRIFSTYVLEHCVFPRIFLRECLRVLRPNGMFLLVCPNFLGRGKLSSQRAGYSVGNGRDKLKLGRVFDAMVTAIDRKVRIPWAAAKARRAARTGQGGFWVNPTPTCFADAFYADVDAVYLTYDWEIIRELEQGGAEIVETGTDPERIFLVARRVEKKL